MSTPDPGALRARELALQRIVLIWILTGLAFMLLPGTFLGVWNLIEISGRHGAAQIAPSWIQAHGHAQIFGWIGSFILGIGFYSLSKMARTGDFPLSRAWISWALWTAGVSLRWSANIWQWNWRWLLPASALLELAAFLLFFVTVRKHGGENPNQPKPALRMLPVWMLAVIAGSIGFLASLLANLAAVLYVSLAGSGPAVPHDWNQRLLALFAWAFPVATIWGFSSRWLPVFLGLQDPSPLLLIAALAVNTLAVASALAGVMPLATTLFLVGALLAVTALRVFARPSKPAKITGVHRSFPAFVRLAYAWLLISAVISVAASLWDRSGGLWGSSRHALTVGFISTMVFAIGQRVLPAFCGMRVLFSPRLMFACLTLLNAGCALRVASEIGAYEGYVPALWPLLPVSAIVEMTAVTLFAVNLVLTFSQAPAHLAGDAARGTGWRRRLRPPFTAR